jgi:preprotein translocase subunit SecE
MASKAAIEKGEQRSAKLQEPGALKNVSTGAIGGAIGFWTNASGFLSDVRAEMRKVVTPTRKEVQATTAVVIVTVFIFGFFFFVVDMIFNRALHEVLTRLGGAQ